MAGPTDIRHLDGSTPRIMVVDGSRLVRKLIEDVLRAELPAAEVVACASLAEARAALAAAPIDLATTSLLLPDGQGQKLAQAVRAAAGQRYVPVVVISGNAREQLEARQFSDDVTDYFDKSLGHRALAEFIRGYVQPATVPGARVLYVEDSRTVALATTRMLQAQQLEVEHVTSVEAAIGFLESRGGGAPGVDLVLTDVYLRGDLDGGDLVDAIRNRFGWSRRRLPVLVMTGDANPDNQAALLRSGANDLVLKPIEERLLVTKLLFQLRLSRLPEPGASRP